MVAPSQLALLLLLLRRENRLSMASYFEFPNRNNGNRFREQRVEQHMAANVATVIMISTG